MHLKLEWLVCHSFGIVFVLYFHFHFCFLFPFLSLLIDLVHFLICYPLITRKKKPRSETSIRAPNPNELVKPRRHPATSPNPRRPPPDLDDHLQTPSDLARPRRTLPALNDLRPKAGNLAQPRRHLEQPPIAPRLGRHQLVAIVRNVPLKLDVFIIFWTLIKEVVNMWILLCFILL